MKTNPNIFKAYDIRGIYGEDLDEETAYKLGRAYVTIRREEVDKEKLNIVVGADMRISSPQLKEALIRGITENGANVIDIGLASTPTFYFAVANYNYDGGIIVSASHNPGEYNGFKLTRERAIPISGETGIMQIRDLVMTDDFGPQAETPGTITTKENVLQKQIAENLEHVELEQFKKLKIVVDPANGMGAQYLEELFKHIPAELVKINFELDGNFPAHEADPLKEENMTQLQEKVLEVGADLGIATDGDGDRVFFVDNKGQTINQAIIRGLLAKIFLREKPGAKIGYDVRPGRITIDLIKENGGVPMVTRVGHSLIKEQVLRENAYFAGESSGHFYLNMPIGCFDVPTIVILELIQYFSELDTDIASYLKQYDKYYHSGEINSVVKDVDDVFRRIEEKYSDGNISKLDGILVEYDDFWFNVRASNTEPKIRLNLEAVDEETMKEKRDEILAIINA
jgi:phosphomannomutase